MRIRLILTALVLILLSATTVQARQGLTKIADNVYSYVDVRNASPGNSFAANAGIVVGDRGILVVDTLISAKEAKRLIADIRRVSNKPVLYVVDTHYHLDHALGNSEFARLGATIVSQARDRQLLAERGEATLKGIGAYGLTADDMAGTRIALPTLTFTDRMAIDLGGVTVELLHVAPSHSPGSALVFIPERKVLFTGDILFTDFHPFMGDGDQEGWAKSLDFIQTLDAAWIVPGHGPLSGKNDVADMKDYLQAFDREARRITATDSDPDRVTAELLRVLPKKSQGEFLVKANAQMLYLKK